MAVLRGGGKAGRISSCGADCCVTVLDAANGDVLARFRAGKHALSCVAATPGVSTGSATWCMVWQQTLPAASCHYELP